MIPFNRKSIYIRSKSTRVCKCPTCRDTGVIQDKNYYVNGTPTVYGCPTCNKRNGRKYAVPGTNLVYRTRDSLETLNDGIAPIYDI